ncbi:AbgT family transporter [Silanimonas sp.]|jgi:aminobenzoyl-glutamate transport protein|uniref:AbgT family transporter n=1 Tax=Silanimonas sp. TaxID=1929290 RepID=UPI0022C8B450|nr:AbgT family transporter [Silanimonas sp.]MCZ8113867.1 AbgT family transporter [Silanimonas sp.]
MSASDALPAAAPRTAVDRFLAIVERAGNLLPHPATLFFLLTVFVVIASAIAAQFDLSVAHPKTGEPVVPVNLLSVDGLQRIMGGLVTNFTGFAPLGTVLVALIGIGVAEHSGLIGACLRMVVLKSPRYLLTPIVVFAGVMSNMASEIGYVMLVPLAALLFIAAGRHPILGIAAAFAGVSGGYSANLLLGTIDPLLSSLSQEAARIVDPTYTVSPAANLFFMQASTPVITLLGWFVTEKIVARRFPDGQYGRGDEKIEPLSDAEKRGLAYAGLATLVFTALLLLATVPANGALRIAGEPDLLKALEPFLAGIVALIFVAGALIGIAYGVGAGTIKSDNDVIKGMSASMGTLASYLVLVFFAAQFVELFKWTNLGLIFAVEGAEMLKALGLPKIPLLLGFILLTATVNLAMGSASAKWALMAPVFVPMFMLLGYSPEVTQTAYRVGDSVTNIISPMMSYFALIIAFLQRYEPKAGIGTVVATMIPYSITFLIGWSCLFALWIFMGWPLGPGAALTYTPAG